MRPPPGPTRPPAAARSKDRVLINMLSKATSSDLLKAPAVAGGRHFFINAYATHRRSRYTYITGPDFDENACFSFFSKQYSDPHRDYIYSPPKGLQRPPPPKIPFNSSIPSKDKCIQILHKRSNNSAPGSNSIPYLVYKKLSCCTDLLYLIISRILKEGKVPKCYCWTNIFLIPKDLDAPSKPNSFRPIACANVEGKVLWLLLDSLSTIIT